MKLRYLLVLMLLGAIWGSSFPFVQMALSDFGPLTIVALRLIGAALLLTLLLPRQGLWYPASWRAWRDMLIVGMLGTSLPMALITWGSQYISSGLAAILVATTPLFTLLLSLLWYRHQRPGFTTALGIGLGFGGVLLALDVFNVDVGSTSMWGILAVLAAATSYALEGLYAHRAFHDTPAMVAAAGTLTGGAIVITPLALLSEGLPLHMPGPSALLGLLGLTFGSSALAYILFFWVLERIGAPRASMVTYLVPIFALLFGWWWLNEAVGAHTLLGLALVLSGIMLTNRPAQSEAPAGEATSEPAYAPQ